jgi:hypothetical protein
MKEAREQASGGNDRLMETVKCTVGGSTVDLYEPPTWRVATEEAEDLPYVEEVGVC